VTAKRLVISLRKKQNPSSAWQEAGGRGGRWVVAAAAAAAAISRGPASIARPCVLEFTIIGAHV